MRSLSLFAGALLVLGIVLNPQYSLAMRPLRAGVYNSAPSHSGGFATVASTGQDSVPSFTMAFLQKLATVKQSVEQLVAAQPALSAAWSARGAPELQAQLVVATPALKAVYTSAGLSPIQGALSMRQLNKIYWWEHHLSEKNPGVDVGTLVTPAMGNAGFIENFRFVAAHQKEVDALKLVEEVVGPPMSVMNMNDSTDPPAGGPAASEQTLRVLFIGNSLVYINDIPAQFRSIAAAGMHRRIVTRMITIPGAPLEGRWGGGLGIAAQVLNFQRWDVVVLQGRPFQNDDGGFDTLNLGAVVKAIAEQSQHARVLLYVPSQGDEGSRMGMMLDSLYTRVGRPLGITPVCAGSVMDKFKKANPALRKQLFLSDGSHQSALGAYLQALVLYTTLTQKSPVGLPHPVLPGLTDSLATHFELAAASVLPHAPSSSTLLSHPFSHPSITVELYTDRSCASCAAAEAAIAALVHSNSIPQVAIVPMVWPVGVAGVPTPDATRARLAATLAVQPGATAASTAPPDTNSLVLPRVLVDGVPTPVDSLKQAVVRAAQYPHPWITATTLDGEDLGVIVAPVPTAAPTDSVDVSVVVTEDIMGAKGAAPTLPLVRGTKKFTTVSVQQGLEEEYTLPTLPQDVVYSRIHVIVLVQTHGTGHMVGEAEIPLMAYRGDRR